MMQNLTKTSVRKGNFNFFRKWVSKLAAPVLVVFPVPGEEYFRAKGIYLNDFFDVAASPREANVLLAAAPLNEKLAQKIAVVYLQMPRPRAFILAGTGKDTPLPEPDFQISVQKPEIGKLKSDLIKHFQKPYREDADTFHPAFVKEMLKDKDEEEHHHHHGEGENHENSHQRGHQNENKEGKEKNGKHQSDDGGHENNHGGHNPGENGSGQQDENGGDGGHDHGGGMGFMSMVKMTKDMPRATDGLPMERNMAWFGPFFPGLPGGLAFQFTLDGDTVVKTEADRSLFCRDLSGFRDVSFKNLPEEISKLNPLHPLYYKILAEQLTNPQKELNPQQIALLEKERIFSHLNWLANFAVLLGNHWIEKEAVRQMRNVQNNVFANLHDFTQTILHFKYLKKKLQHTGEIPEVLLHHVSGPVARAADKSFDARSSQKNYQNAGFKPIVLNENNAWGRLKIRLLEILQSVEMLNKIEFQDDFEKHYNSETLPLAAFSAVELEGPAGIISAEMKTRNEKLQELKINEASAVHAVLAEEIVKEMELSDALITIASLDINPFAVAGFSFKNEDN